LVCQKQYSQGLTIGLMNRREKRARSGNERCSGEEHERKGRDMSGYSGLG
jgi:hypothetical protein